jgi:uncharacterized protein YjiS (DUF1127 family)
MQPSRSCTAPFSFLHRTRDAYIRSDKPVSAGDKRNKTMLLSIVRFLQDWKRYGTAMRELSNLSDRELADIGITRGDIPHLAWPRTQQ